MFELTLDKTREKQARAALEQMMDDFGRANGKTQEQTLRKVFDASPDLTLRTVQAAGDGDLKRFALHDGGQYDIRTGALGFPTALLARAGKEPTVFNDMVFTAGHEVQHALNQHGARYSLEEFRQWTESTVTDSATPRHDYTDLVDRLIERQRTEEARAHIGGFNALSSRLDENNWFMKPTLEELYKAEPFRMGDFIERTGQGERATYALKPGLSLDKDMQMPLIETNIEAMRGYYFDKPVVQGHGHGANHDQDYRHHIADGALWVINRIEPPIQQAFAKDPSYRAPSVEVDFARLGLDPSRVTPGIVVDTAAVRVVDASTLARPDAVDARAPSSASPGLDHPLYTQALSALQRGDVALPRGGPEAQSNLAAAIAVKAQSDGLTGIDKLIDSTHPGQLIAMQANDPLGASWKRSGIDDVAAKTATPSADTLARLLPVQTQALATDGPTSRQVSF